MSPRRFDSSLSQGKALNPWQLLRWRASLSLAPFATISRSCLRRVCDCCPAVWKAAGPSGGQVWHVAQDDRHQGMGLQDAVQSSEAWVSAKHIARHDANRLNAPSILALVCDDSWLLPATVRRCPCLSVHMHAGRLCTSYLSIDGFRPNPTAVGHTAEICEIITPTERHRVRWPMCRHHASNARKSVA